MKPIHVQLAYKGRHISVFKVLTVLLLALFFVFTLTMCIPYLRTFENSLVGDTTKLSLDGDHEIKCCMLPSSSMLPQRSEMFF